MRQLKKCFGMKKYFFKEKIKECVRCQFRDKCHRQVKGRYNNEE